MSPFSKATTISLDSIIRDFISDDELNDTNICPALVQNREIKDSNKK